MFVGKSPEERTLAGEECGFSFMEAVNKLRSGQPPVSPGGLWGKLFSLAQKGHPPPPPPPGVPGGVWNKVFSLAQQGKQPPKSVWRKIMSVAKPPKSSRLSHF